MNRYYLKCVVRICVFDSKRYQIITFFGNMNGYIGNSFMG